MTLRVEVKNIDEVRRILEQLGAQAASALPAAVEEGAKVLAAKIAENAPGPHIAYEMNGSSALVGPDKAHFYYAFFETGTSRHMVEPREKQALKWGETYAARAFPGGVAASPFMRPAVDEGADAVGAAVGKVLAEALE